MFQSEQRRICSIPLTQLYSAREALANIAFLSVKQVRYVLNLSSYFLTIKAYIDAEWVLSIFVFNLTLISSFERFISMKTHQSLYCL